MVPLDISLWCNWAFFDLLFKEKQNKVKISKWSYIKTKSFCIAKETISNYYEEGSLRNESISNYGIRLGETKAEEEYIYLI